MRYSLKKLLNFEISITGQINTLHDLDDFMPFTNRFSVFWHNMMLLYIKSNYIFWINKLSNNYNYAKCYNIETESIKQDRK